MAAAAVGADWLAEKGKEVPRGTRLVSHAV